MRTHRWAALLLTWAAVAGAQVEPQIERFLAEGSLWPEVATAIAEQGPDAVDELVALAAGEPGPKAKAAWLALMYAVESARGPARDGYGQALLDELAPGLAADLRIRLVDLAGQAAGEGTVARLAALLSDADLREPARRALARADDPGAGAVLAQAGAAADGAWRQALLEALAFRADAAGVPVLEAEFAAGGERAVAAMRLMGRHGDVAFAEPLQAALGDAALRAAAVDALLALAARRAAAGGDVADLYAALLERSGGLAAHQVSGALVGLARAAGADALPALLRAVDHADAGVRGTAGARLLELGDAAAPAIAQRLPVALPRGQAVLLAVLADIAPLQAVAPLTDALESRDAELRRTALELLGRVGDAAVAERLLALAREDLEELRPIALAAYLAVAGRQADLGQVDAAREMLHQGFAAATRDDERRLALQGLAGLADPRSLDLVRGALDSGGTRAAAAAAAVAIAETMLREGRRDEALALFEEGMAAGDRAVAARAVARLRELGVDRDFARDKGFISRWRIIGPFPNAGNEAAKRSDFPETEPGFDAEHEVAGRKLRWQAVRVDDPGGAFDLRSAMKPDSNVAAYAYAEVTVPTAQEARLAIGSDDGIIVWANGEKVHEFTGNRALSIDQDKVPVTLQAGVNRLLIKVLQGGGDWGYAIRLTRPDGSPLEYEQAEF